MSNIITDGERVYFTNDVTEEEVIKELAAQQAEKEFFEASLLEQDEAGIITQTQANIDRCSKFLEELNTKKLNLKRKQYEATR